MTQDEKIKIIAEVLESEDEISPDMLLADQEGWTLLSSYL